MGNLTIYYNDIAGDATLTASSENSTAGFGKERVQDEDPNVTHRTTAILSQFLILDHGSASNVKGVYVGNNNIVAGDTTFQFQAGTTTSTTDKALDFTKGDSNAFLDIPSWSYRYNALRYTKASGTYIEVGNVLILQNKIALSDECGEGNYSEYDEKITEETENKRTGFIRRNVLGTRKVISELITVPTAIKDILSTIDTKDYVVVKFWNDWEPARFGTIDFSPFRLHTKRTGPHNNDVWWQSTVTFREITNIGG